MTSEKSFLYGEPFGERDLREQIAAYLLESRGVKTDADSIIIGSSTQQMLIYLRSDLRDRDLTVPERLFNFKGFLWKRCLSMKTELIFLNYMQ